MRQFDAVKKQHPDKILFFRMGDFYEMFGEDAVKAAPILGITLTSRSHGEKERIPLAGVPYHSADRYLAKLLAAGKKVVIVEQVEDPKLAKGLVKREVVEILTPGTATLGESESVPSTLAAVYSGNGAGSMGIASLDMSTGTFLVDEGPAAEMIERLRVLEPSEVIFPEGMGRDKAESILTGAPGVSFSEFGDWNFDLATAERELGEQFGIATLDGFGLGEAKLATIAGGAVFRYLRENHREQLSHINRLQRIDSGECMALDYSTVRNLELVRNTSDGSETNSLFEVTNHCHTAAGARRLRQNLLRPFTQREKIELRLGAVAELIKDRERAATVRAETKLLPDLEKLCGRIGMRRLTPRQAAAVSNSLTISNRLESILRDCHSPHLRSLSQYMPDMTDLAAEIMTALSVDPPVSSLKGGVIKRGYSAELDALNDSIREARQYIAGLQKSERERTGINSLKVGFNKVFGYYLEVTRANSSQVPEQYIRKQTLVNAERYVTPELKEREELILAAEEKIFRLESELFDILTDTIGKRIGELIQTAELLAEIDLVTALAELAVSRGYCRPELFDDSRLNIINGRHPVIESVLAAGAFVANDLELDDQRKRIIILTGPNMSGKSTYLRQIGLIVILAQIGSFVPADSAEIGIVDRVFTRVGALDNLARGQSTFLVEMVETANILHNATGRSLILLDEVGRGTSTFDGLSVAWSAVEFIVESLAARTVFATHYHELTGMAALCESVENYQVAVKKWENQVIFMHRIIPGGCDDSYGIEVARLAGLPRSTIKRAREILRLLESGRFQKSELARGIHKQRVQPNLFDSPPSVVEEELRAVDIDNLTPMQAFDLLRKLKTDMK